MKTILCVEDEQRILRNNEIALMEAGYAVLTAETLEQARTLMAAQAPDGLVLDIMLPDGNGLDYLGELRAQGNRIPILMLTAWNSSADIARGLDMGADDYIGKPFTYDVLLSRIKKMLSNAERVPERILRGALSLDITARAAYLDGEDMLITQKEFSLLLIFMQNEDRIVNTQVLLEKVWGTMSGLDKRALRTHISNLRSRLEEGNSGYTIRAAYGEGYTFEKA